MKKSEIRLLLKLPLQQVPADSKPEILLVPMPSEMKLRLKLLLQLLMILVLIRYLRLAGKILNTLVLRMVLLLILK